jgi:type I site-specific restriction endonuclease
MRHIKASAGLSRMASDSIDVKPIADLVVGFRANLTDLHDPQTSEAVVRQEYIDPFWKALGWDVANDGHRSHAEKDVLIEAPVGTIEGERAHNRRPDYLFRIDGFPRFVVEAKKPAVDPRTDKDSIFQAKTYAWSAQIPFAILTDFERFRLFDTTIKPYLEEPTRGLIEEFDLRFEDYITQWDVLQQTFIDAKKQLQKGAAGDRAVERLQREIEAHQQ